MKNKNLKVEYCTRKPMVRSRFRNVYWRIVPSELKWWQRPFNRWHKMFYYEYDGSSSDLFSHDEYHQMVDCYKTVEDIEKREEKYRNIISDLWKDEDK